MAEVKEDNLQVIRCGRELALSEQMTVADSFFVLLVYATEQLDRHFCKCPSWVSPQGRFLIKSGLPLKSRPTGMSYIQRVALLNH